MLTHKPPSPVQDPPESRSPGEDTIHLIIEDETAASAGRRVHTVRTDSGKRLSAMLKAVHQLLQPQTGHRDARFSTRIVAEAGPGQTHDRELHPPPPDQDPTLGDVFPGQKVVRLRGRVNESAGDARPAAPFTTGCLRRRLPLLGAWT